jgi:hypothetical protein
MMLSLNFRLKSAFGMVEKKENVPFFIVTWWENDDFFDARYVVA